MHTTDSIQAEKVNYLDQAELLDSSNAFEGPEKTLRLFFASPNASASSGFLQIQRSEWEAMLDLVKCKVLSVLVHAKLHAYVLSESSMFVYPDHIVLKTCGTTTLLDGLPAILGIVDRYFKNNGVSYNIVSAFYSRRSYMNPEKQPHPHGCWDDEVSRLKNFFSAPSYACHFGVNRDERWHLFTHSSFPCASSSLLLNDGWVELMMTGLDHDLTAKYHTSHHESVSESLAAGKSLEESVMSLDSVTSMVSSVGADPDDDDPGHLLGNLTTASARVDELFSSDKQCIDSFSFNPCGYSCNGILLELGKYFTIHVTPESGSSYASFETNVGDPGSVEAGLTHQTLVDRVLELFRPEKITLVICMPTKKSVIDISRVGCGAYKCTSEAEFEIGNASVIQYSFRKS